MRALHKIRMSAYLVPGAEQNTGNPLLAIRITSLAPIRLLNLWKSSSWAAMSGLRVGVTSAGGGGGGWLGNLCGGW